MSQEVLLGRIRTVLAELEYPIDRDVAAEALAGTTVLFADGEIELDDLVGRARVDRFASAEDLEAEIHNCLPRRAVGEPYQSEGDA